MRVHDTRANAALLRIRPVVPALAHQESGTYRAEGPGLSKEKVIAHVDREGHKSPACPRLATHARKSCDK